MQSSQDLNSNLIKSLTSVHLPPPPSSHAQYGQQSYEQNRPSQVAFPHPSHTISHFQKVQQKTSQRSLKPQPSTRPQKRKPTEGIEHGQLAPQQLKPVPEVRVSEFNSSHSQINQQLSVPAEATFEVPQQHRQELATPVHTTAPASSPPLPASQLSDTTTAELDKINIHSDTLEPHQLHLEHSVRSFDIFSDEPETTMIPGKMLEPELHVVPGQMLHPKTISKRKSHTGDELALPLTTPPHTITRTTGAARPAKKSKTLETPTLQQGRSKKSVKNPLSPQYSSPSQENQLIDSTMDSIPATSTIQASKPPQPTFTAPKTKKSREQQRELKKLKQKEEEDFVLPPPHLMPKIVYPDDTKPPYSYATLIGMAILRGRERKLTLSQIYHWISTTFKYYSKNDVGWQNSIRHNLSLNKAFLKAEKSPDGKGHYWEVASGFEMQFMKGKMGRRFVPTEQNKTGSIKSSDSPSSEASAQISQGEIQLDADDMTSEDEFSDDDGADDHTKTPKAQIGASCEMTERPSLKKSHTAIGLQRFNLPRVTYEDADAEDDSNKIPRKKQQLRSVSTGTGNLSKIPTLEAPDTNWAASALGDKIIFGQVKPDTESPKARMTSFPVTSSFSCNTNFELSPLKRQETGPLLEPLTPSSRVPSFTTTATAKTLSVPSTQQSLAPKETLVPHTSKTPLHNSSSSHQNVVNGLNNSATAQHFYNFMKTPTAKSRTPNTNNNSIMRKFWNSPAFIDDFYTSPSISRNDGGYRESMFGSPERKDRKHPFMENTTGYGCSDLFGVDICSVVQRAVESCNNKDDGDAGSTTDDDVDANNTV